MNKHKTQSGFAHLAIIVVILTIALIGSLGYIFWQKYTEMNGNKSANVATSKNTDDDADNTVDADDAKKYKTYVMDGYDLSFDYPENWSVSDVKVAGDADPYIMRSVDVKNENGKVVASLVHNLYGIGGTCGPNGPISYTNLDSEVSAIKADKPVSFNAYLFESSESSADKYEIIYGLDNIQSEKGKIHSSCFYISMFESDLLNSDSSKMLISFTNSFLPNNTEKFSSLDDVNAYIASDEFKEIKKMILSLTY